MDPALVRRLSTNHPLLTVPTPLCENGWYGLLDRMLRDLQSLVRSAPGSTLYLDEIRSKGGWLKVKYEFMGDEIAGGYIDQVIKEAMGASGFICELCGGTVGTALTKNDSTETVTNLCGVCQESGTCYGTH